MTFFPDARDARRVERLEVHSRFGDWKTSHVKMSTGDEPHANSVIHPFNSFGSMATLCLSLINFAGLSLVFVHTLA